MGVLYYWKFVEAAIKKHASGKSEDERQDIRQRIYLDLLAIGGGVTEKKAYKVACKSVIQYIQDNKFGGKIETLSEPSVFRIAENQQAREYDISGDVDITRIVEVLEKLPATDKIIITMFFGLYSMTPQTIKTIAHWLGEPEIWVRRRKNLALEKIRSLIK